MSDAPDNIVLVYLRRLDQKVDRLIDDVRDLKLRVTTVETQIGQFMATEQSHYAATMARFDNVEKRLDRLERQADILPA